MKYALNHPWKFEYPVLAVFTGFLQVFVAFVIELVNYILVVGSNTYMEIVLSVLALYFTISFGNIFFYQPYSGKNLRKLIKGVDDKYQNFLRIQLKTSPRYTIYKTRKQ